MPPPPSRTPQAIVTRALHARQVVTVTSTSSTEDDSSSGSNLSGGAIAGIVIGSIVGLLLLLWIIRSFKNLGRPPQEPPREKTAWYDDVGSRRSRSRGHSRRHNSHHSRHHHHHGHGHRRSGSYYVTETHAPRRSSRGMSFFGEPRFPSKTYVVRD